MTLRTISLPLLLVVLALPQSVQAQQPGASARVARRLHGTLVQVDPVPPAIITIRFNGHEQTFSITEDAAITRQITGLLGAATTPDYGPAATIGLRRLIPGEDVTLGLDALDQVVQITASVSIVKARVRSVQGSQLVLDDRWSTTLLIGPQVRFVNAQGQATAVPTIQPGDTVALFVAPASRAIYQVSANYNDIAAAPSATPPVAAPPAAATPPTSSAPASPAPVTPAPPRTVRQPVPAPEPTRQPAVRKPTAPPRVAQIEPVPVNPPPIAPPVVPPGLPQIILVKHNAPRPLGHGAVLRVTVRGTPRERGTFDVPPRLQGLPLVEDPAQPGVYVGEYTVQPGDDVLNAPVLAHLQATNGTEDVATASAPVTIDTTPPRITAVLPGDRATITVAQPNLAIVATDTGGSGLATASMTITNNGQTFTVPTTVAPPESVTAVVPRPLSGLTTVQVTVTDAAKNSVTTTFGFTVAGVNGGITSLTHSASRALQVGEDVTVDLAAPTGGKATLDVLADNNRSLAQAIPLREYAPGHYRGTYRIQENPDIDRVRLVGRFTDDHNQVSAAEATTPVLVLDSKLPPVVITQPEERDRPASPLTVRGRAQANALVEVALHAEGLRASLLGLFEDLPSQQVRADGNGNWETQLDLPNLRSTTMLRYTISATQIDIANRRSTPATVTLRVPLTVPTVTARPQWPSRGRLASRGGPHVVRPQVAVKTPGAKSRVVAAKPLPARKPVVHRPAPKGGVRKAGVTKVAGRP